PSVCAAFRNADTTRRGQSAPPNHTALRTISLCLGLAPAQYPHAGLPEPSRPWLHGAPRVYLALFTELLMGSAGPFERPAAFSLDIFMIPKIRSGVSARGVAPSLSRE